MKLSLPQAPQLHTDCTDPYDDNKNYGVLILATVFSFVHVQQSSLSLPFYNQIFADLVQSYTDNLQSTRDVILNVVLPVYVMSSVT